jgi:hypothetical protein
MEHPDYWPDWARTLHQKQLTGLVVSLLEGLGPARLFVSQAILSFTPFLGARGSDSMHLFARILEDQEECKTFASFLREENQF